MAIDYGTQRLVGGGPSPGPGAAVTGIAGSMRQRGAPLGWAQQLNPNLVTPAGNMYGYAGRQPYRRLDFPAPAAPPGNLPPSDTTTQTGQGGGQGLLPGASPGQVGQAQGIGRTPTNDAIQKPTPDPLPTSNRPQQTNGVLPGMEGGSKTPIGAVPGAPTATNLPIGVNANAVPPAAWNTPQGILDAMNKRHATINQPMKVPPPDPMYRALNPNGAPMPRPGGDTTQQFNSNFQPTGATAFSRLAQQALDRHLYGQKGVDLQNMPKSFTIADFNNAAQTNPVLAAQMLGKGGQAYKDAIMKANGWSNYQMNQFINAYASGVEPGITQSNLTAAGFTPERFGTNTLTPPAPPPPTNQPPAPPPATGGGTEAGFGYFDP